MAGCRPSQGGGVTQAFRVIVLRVALCGIFVLVHDCMEINTKHALRFYSLMPGGDVMSREGGLRWGRFM